MIKLNPTSRAWLKSIHILLIGAWVGAACSMVLLQFVSHPKGGDELYAVNATLKQIDDFMVIPTAIGSLLTGLLLSFLTPWGFFKWRWITLKWVLTLGVILFGTFALGPWLNGMVDISATERLAALQNPTYNQYHQMMTLFSSPQVSLLLFMVIISGIKPWGRSKKAVTKAN